MRIIVVTCLMFFTLFMFDSDGQDSFVPPLNIPLSLSANFGEIRPDHYHSGIDLKTQGVTGKEVFSAADGYVYLILVSPVGFGKAIYIRHPFGLSTVYAHLDNYAPDIEEYVKNQQYRNKTFAITITPPVVRLPVKRGQLIGYSGNTGGSTGPHLHFEVRKSEGEKPVDPLRYGFGIEDGIRPVLERLAIYPLSPESVVNGINQKVLLDLSGSNGNYSIAGDRKISIYGKAGFGISAYDLIDGMPNRFGISSLELLIDSVRIFMYNAGEFSFAETRYINAHIDYEAKIRYGMEIERLYALPNDRLSMYKDLRNRGVFEFADTLSHKVTINVCDTKGNSSTLSFSTEPSDPADELIAGEAGEIPAMIFPYQGESIFRSDGITLTIPSGALYDTLCFGYSVTRINGGLLSPVHRIHNRYTPLHRAARLSIRPDTVISGKESKLIMVHVDDKGQKSYSGGAYSAGFVTSEIRNFGSYAVYVDTIPPVINGNSFSDGADLTGRSSVRFRISDNISGIKSYNCLIDGSWALFEYDAKNEVIFHKFDPARTVQGKVHTLEITVSDNCGNTTVLTRRFTW